MSTATTTPTTTGAAAANNVNNVNNKAAQATSGPTTEQKLQILPEKAEAEHAKNVTIQFKKSLATERKVAQELAAKGKLAILQDHPSRPVRCPVKKGRKPLDPPANKDHDSRYAAGHAKGVRTMRTDKKIRDAVAKCPRALPTEWDYGVVVEQRVVDGNVKEILQPACVAETIDTGSDDDSVYDSTSDSNFDSDSDEPFFTTDYVAAPADGWSFVEELSDDSSSDMSASESSEADIDVQLATEEVQPLPEHSPKGEDLDVAVLEPSSWRPLPLSLPNAAAYPSRLTRDQEAALVAMHVTPLVFPDTDIRKKASNAGNKVAESVKANKEVDAVNDAGSTAALNATSSDAVEESTFLSKFRSMPNGPGETIETRNRHDKLVAMHVSVLQFPTSMKHQKQVNQEEANTVVVEPVAIAELDSTTDDPTPIKETMESKTTTPTSPKEATKSINEQGRSFRSQNPIPVPANDNTPVSSPVSSPNRSSSNSSAPQSSNTSHPFSDAPSSRGSSMHLSTDSSSTSPSLRRKTEVARTTFLGSIALASFVQALDFELVDGTTTKDDICSAFVFLTGYAATSPELETAKVQRKIKLGDTPLYGFLKTVTFDGEDVASLNSVMRAFKRSVDGEGRDRGLKAVEMWDDGDAQDAQEGVRGRTASKEA